MRYKFRGKRIDGQGWVEGDLIRHYENQRRFIALDQMAYTYTENGISRLVSERFHEVIPESVGQWTGLVDKNGVEIYEGDILKMHQFLFDGNEYEKETIGVIKRGEYGWLLSQIDGKEVNEYMGYKNGEGETYLIHFYGLHEESFEIIANIHDNPELMEVE